MRYDLAIIGGGPAGYTAAERAAKGGLKTLLIEKNALGDSVFANAIDRITNNQSVSELFN